jgi:hypothetical protein
MEWMAHKARKAPPVLMVYKEQQVRKVPQVRME